MKQIRDWTAKEKEVTFILNGKDDLGKVQKNTVGIYSLLDAEKKAQDEARAEKEYLQPIWARAAKRRSYWSSAARACRKRWIG